MGCGSVIEAFSVNCLCSVPAFAGCFLELNDVYRVLSSTNMSFKVLTYFYDESEFIVSHAVDLERTVFPFVKQCIEDKMAAECSYPGGGGGRVLPNITNTGMCRPKGS